MKKNSKRILLLVFIVAGIIAFRLSGLDQYLSFEKLQENKVALLQIVNTHYLASIAAFTVAYVLVTALSLPGAAIMTLAGGFLFGMISIIYVNIGATAGAVIAFLVSRYLAGEWVQEKYGGRLKKFNEEIEKNGQNYLLTLRLIPVFPFFLINIFSGLTIISLKTFIWTTAIGIIPGSLVYVFAGTQLSTIQSPGDILSTNIIIAFVLLGLLSLVPVLIQRIKQTRFIRQQ